MLTAALAVLCALLVLVLLVQRPAIWLLLVVLVVLWGVLFVLFRCRLRSWVARWVCGGSFEKSKTQFSLEPLSQPAALLSGETVLWYNAEFRTRLMKGESLLTPRVQKVLPGLDLQESRTAGGQLLNLADGAWSVHSSTVPGEAESMTLLVLNEETALRKVEAEYKASRPGYLVFLVDGYDDVFSDMLDSERARLLEGINRVLEDMIGRGTGFLRRVASGRYIAVVEERQLEQFAKRGYDVLDKIRALDPSVNLSISIGIGRGAKTLREAQDMAVQALDMAQGRGGDQAAEMTPDGFTFYGGVSHGVEKRSKVRSRIVADQLVKLIKEADHVVIMGHRMSDLDAIGAAEGVLRICKICDVPAVIAVRRDATLAGSLINALVAAGQEDDFIDPKGALPIISQRTLCIIVDTYQLGLVESREILEKCGKVIYDSLNCIVWSGTPTEPVQTVSVSPNVLTELKNSDIYYSQRFECDDPNVVIVEEDHYAYCSFIKITGTDSPAKIKWYAYTFASSYNVPYESEIGDLGEATEFSNPISSDNTARQNTADWMADYLSKRRQYTVETLGYPEVDPGDLILYNGKEATVVEANINFNQGAMRETFILRGEEKLNGVANT